MIIIKDRFFLLNTDNTSYSFMVSDEGALVHLHYGGLINIPKEKEDAQRALTEKVSHSKGTSIEYKPGSLTVMEDTLLEVSSVGKGDIRDPFIVVEYADGSVTSDFLYKSHELVKEVPASGLPGAYGADSILKVTLKEANKPLELDLYYALYEKEDCMVRKCLVRNPGEEEVKIKRVMSNQLDLPGGTHKYVTFGGNWVREMEKHEVTVDHGLHINRTLSGVSSNRNNPFVMVGDPDINEHSGEGYGFNLIYSGNHYEALDVSGFYKTRFLQGIEPDSFSWVLKKGETFDTPEAVMTFSAGGYRGISLNMQHFVRNHIVRGKFKNEPRPILINSWEAAYFNINEAKLLSLAKKAASLGVELFVMDDGWFKGRNNDKSSLGDWTVDKEKLPNGVKGLSEKIHEMGLMFGIWVEPEMISEDSDLYRAHPEYAMTVPGRDQSLGRNQMCLDLTNEEVVNYVTDSMRALLNSAKIDYVKWDMNRYFSDVYSKVLEPSLQGETLHRYYLGLYKIMDTLTKEFPNVLFEGCASGGNRFDLGILCYFPQIWGSDDTDAMMRTKIQTGYSYGYPMSTVSAHVSSCPNHQTLRNTPLYTRFNIAAFGLLGYELNFNECKPEELKETEGDIALYKLWRDTFFFGDFYRVTDKQWMVVSPDKKKAVTVVWNEMVNPNDFFLNLRTVGLDNDKLYHIYNIPMKHNIKEFGDLVNQVAPIHVKKDSVIHNTLAKFIKMDGESEDYIASGSLLNKAGLKLSQAFGGTGYNSETRLFQDFESRIYYMEAAEEQEL